MSLDIEYHELARADLYAAWVWYEDQQSGLGDRFAVAVDAVVLRANPVAEQRRADPSRRRR